MTTILFNGINIYSVLPNYRVSRLINQTLLKLNLSATGCVEDADIKLSQKEQCKLL